MLKINPSTLTLEQQNEVKLFFGKSGIFLQKIG